MFPTPFTFFCIDSLKQQACLFNQKTVDEGNIQNTALCFLWKTKKTVWFPSSPFKRLFITAPPILPCHFTKPNQSSIQFCFHGLRRVIQVNLTLFTSPFCFEQPIKWLTINKFCFSLFTVLYSSHFTLTD